MDLKDFRKIINKLDKRKFDHDTTAEMFWVGCPHEDYSVFLALADYLEEIGDVRALGLRWLCRHKRAPCLTITVIIEDDGRKIKHKDYTWCDIGGASTLLVEINLVRHRTLYESMMCAAKAIGKREAEEWCGDWKD